MTNFLLTILLVGGGCILFASYVLLTDYLDAKHKKTSH